MAMTPSSSALSFAHMAACFANLRLGFGFWYFGLWKE